MNETIQTEQPFRMVIDAIFTIKNRGVFVIGKVESGRLSRNESVLVMGYDKVLHVSVASIDHFNPIAPDTHNTGIMLRNVQREDVDIGMIVTTEGL